MNSIDVKISLLKAGLTEATLGKAVGLSQPGVHYILTGQRPGYKYQTRIARMLKVKIADLFGTKRPKRGRPFKQNGK